MVLASRLALELGLESATEPLVKTWSSLEFSRAVKTWFSAEFSAEFSRVCESEFSRVCESEFNTDFKSWSQKGGIKSF